MVNVNPFVFNLFPWGFCLPRFPAGEAAPEPTINQTNKL